MQNFSRHITGHGPATPKYFMRTKFKTLSTLYSETTQNAYFQLSQLPSALFSWHFWRHVIIARRSSLWQHEAGLQPWSYRVQVFISTNTTFFLIKPLNSEHRNQWLWWLKKITPKKICLKVSAGSKVPSVFIFGETVLAYLTWQCTI